MEKFKHRIVVIGIAFSIGCSSNQNIELEISDEIDVQGKNVKIQSVTLQKYRGTNFFKISPVLASNQSEKINIYLPCLEVLTDIHYQNRARSSQKQVEFGIFHVPQVSSRKDNITWQILENEKTLADLAKDVQNIDFEYSQECVDRFASGDF